MTNLSPRGSEERAPLTSFWLLLKIQDETGSLQKGKLYSLPQSYLYYKVSLNTLG